MSAEAVEASKAIFACRLRSIVWGISLLKESSYSFLTLIRFWSRVFREPLRKKILKSQDFYKLCVADMVVV